jgi:hypothetical protein
MATPVIYAYGTLFGYGDEPQAITASQTIPFSTANALLVAGNQIDLYVKARDAGIIDARIHLRTSALDPENTINRSQGKDIGFLRAYPSKDVLIQISGKGHRVSASIPIQRCTYSEMEGCWH